MWTHRIRKAGFHIGRLVLIIAWARQRSVMWLVIKLCRTDNLVEGFTAYTEGRRASRANICMTNLFTSVYILSTLQVLSCAFSSLASSHILGKACVVQLFENSVKSVTIGRRLMVLFFLGKEVRALRDAEAHRFTESLRLLEL